MGYPHDYGNLHGRRLSLGPAKKPREGRTMMPRASIASSPSDLRGLRREDHGVVVPIDLPFFKGNTSGNMIKQYGRIESN